MNRRIVLFCIAIAVVAVAVFPKPDRGGAQTLTISGFSREYWQRASQEGHLHGIWIDGAGLPSTGEWLWAGVFQPASSKHLVQLQEAVHESNEQSGQAKVMEMRIIADDQRLSNSAAVRLWSVGEAMFLSENRWDAVEAERSWSIFNAGCAGEGLPLWAIGRVREYLLARNEIERMLLGGRYQAWAKNTPEAGVWRQRWLWSRERVAKLDSALFDLSPEVERDHYQELIRLSRRTRQATRK